MFSLFTLQLARGFITIQQKKSVTYKRMRRYVSLKPGSDSVEYLDRIKYFFRDGKVSATTGAFMEQIVADKLTDSGFVSFPIPFNIIPRVKFELPVQLWTVQKDPILREADGVVSGNKYNFEKLKQSCPVHVVSGDAFTDKTERVLIVEVKATAATLVQKVLSFKDDDYWIFRSFGRSAGLLSKAIFVNGGEASKQFVLHGGDKSSNIEDRKVWNEIRKAGISLFYKESFTQEWISDLSNTVVRQKTELADQDSKLATQGLKIVDQDSKLSVLRADFEDFKRNR